MNQHTITITIDVDEQVLPPHVPTNLTSYFVRLTDEQRVAISAATPTTERQALLVRMADLWLDMQFAGVS